MNRIARRHILGVGLFTLFYLLVATYFAFTTRNWEFVFYIGAVLVFVFVALAVHVRAGLSSGVLWALSVWGLLHMIGGLMPVPEHWPIAGDKHVFYSWWLWPDKLKFDHVVHAYGFGVATWVCWQALRPALTSQYPTRGILIFCVIAGMGLGALNEVLEFAATLMVPDTNVGGYINTGWDLVANLVGAVMAALLIARFGAHRRG